MHVKPKRTGMLYSPLRFAHHGAAHWPDVLPAPAPRLFAYIRVYWLRTASRRQCRRRLKVVCLCTGRVRPSTSEWVSISLISFNFSVFRPLSRCSKLFNIILSKYFYFALRSCTAFICPALSHIARYAPLLRQVRLHLSIAHASKLASLCIRFALTFAQNKQLRHNNAIQM